ncbi:nitroreductase family protein [Candidatus Woesearchaeota archaeon]|nr:nitroreductase family protein [Candidatus Woesearchaeota archaeon]
MEVLEALHTRRSIRKYLDVPVEWDKVGTILDAGRVAPSAGNLQSWRFVVVRNPEKKKQIADACLQQYWMEQAPVFIVIFAEMNKLENHYGIRGVRLYSIQSCSMAALQMMLAAHSLGLGTCYVSAFDENAMARIFNLPDSVRPQCIITIGYPDETPEAPLRFRLENIAWHEVWNPSNPPVAGTGGSGRVVDPDYTVWNFRVAEKPVQFAKEAAKDIERVTRKRRQRLFSKLKEHGKKFAKKKEEEK